MKTISTRTENVPQRNQALRYVRRLGSNEFLKKFGCQTTETQIMDFSRV